MMSFKAYFPILSLVILLTGVRADLVLYYNFEDDDVASGLVTNHGSTSEPGTLVGADQPKPGYEWGRDRFGRALSIPDAVIYLDTNLTSDELEVNGTVDYKMMAWINIGDTTGDNMIFGKPSGQALHHGVRQKSYHMGHWGK